MPHRSRRSALVLGLVLIGFPLLQILLAGDIIAAARAAGGRGWIPFMLWIVVIEWAFVAVVVWSLRSEGRDLGSVGVPAVRRSDWIGVGTTTVVLALFVLAVGDSTMDRVVNGPWIIPRSVAEKLLMLPVAMTAGFCEEVLFRGFATIELRRRGVPTWASIGLVTAAFALIHGADQPPVLLAARVGAALLFVALVAWRGNLRAAILTHAAIDASLVISL